MGYCADLTDKQQQVIEKNQMIKNISIDILFVLFLMVSFIW